MKFSNKIIKYEIVRNCEDLKEEDELTLIMNEGGIKFFSHGTVVEVGEGSLRIEVNADSHTIGMSPRQRKAKILERGHKESMEEVKESIAKNIAVLK
jgi:hypothetical protein